jgi:hypothetical protein
MATGWKKWPKEKQNDQRTLSERAPEQESGRYRPVGTPGFDLNDSGFAVADVPLLNLKHRVGHNKSRRRQETAPQEGKREKISP